MRVLAIDPSGNFNEGKGHTGYCIVDYDKRTGKFGIKEKGTILAKDYESRVQYWHAVIDLVRKSSQLLIVEDYKLYNHKGMKAQTQSYSQLETPRLLGIIEYFAEMLKFNLVLQMASQTAMYTDEMLIHRGLMSIESKRHYLPVNDESVVWNEHERMSFKHFLVWFDKQKGGN